MMPFLKRTFCPACKGNSYQEIYNCAFSKDPIKTYLKRSYGEMLLSEMKTEMYILYECMTCGLIFQGEILTDEGMIQLYEKWAGTNVMPDNLNLSKEIESLQEILCIIGYFNIPQHNLALFDFGMGNGQWAGIASALGCISYGYDLSSVRVAHAEKKGITILKNELIDNHFFDFINTEQVFEHISHPLDTLLRLKERLRSKGLIKISVPNGRGIKKKIKNCDWEAKKGSKKDLNPIAPLEHINCFNHECIVEMAKIAGLKQVKLPLSLQYHFSLRWNTWQWFRKNLIKPLKRTYTKNGTCLYFSKC